MYSVADLYAGCVLTVCVCISGEFGWSIEEKPRNNGSHFSLAVVIVVKDNDFSRGGGAVIVLNFILYL